MKRHDRIMTITRHPEYLKDWEELKRLRSTDNERAHLWAEEMGERWGEYPPPRPVWGKHPITRFEEYESILEVTSIDEKKHPPLKSNLTQVLEAIAKTKQKGKKEKAKKNEIPDFKFEGKHLYLRVNITEKKTRLMQTFEKLVSSYQQYIPEDNSRDKDITVVSPWLVYDLYHEEGLGISEITHQLIKYKPHVAEPYASTYNAVKRALRKTAETMKYIDEELKGDK